MRKGCADTPLNPVGMKPHNLMPPLKAIRGKPRASAWQGALQIKPTFNSVGCAASVFIGLRHDFSDLQNRIKLQAIIKVT